jgi:uncharacterized membrane protein
MSEHVETPTEEHVVYEFFLWSILLKGAISAAEVAAGVAVFFIPPAFIVSTAILLLNFIPVPSVQSLLLEEVAKYTTGAVTFVAVYLLSRGIVKVVLIWSLLKNRLWAYPASLVVLALFVLYQLYQLVTDRSLIILAISLFDLVVMYFIYREWRIVRRHQTSAL